MTLAAGDFTVPIRLTTVYNPIPNFIHWMEALITDVMHCGFGIEEEGPDKYIFARTHWNGRYQLTISEGDFAEAEEYLKAVVHRRQLIETVYRGFQSFGKSPDYVPRQWGLQTLGERLADKTGTTVDGVVDFLENLDDGSLHKFLHVVLPGSFSGLPEEVERMDSLKEMLSFALLPENLVDADALRVYPIGWKITRSIQGRRDEILNWLDLQESPYDGTPLDTLRSDALEQYLASDRDRDTL